MGCDIHLFVEKKNESGQWEAVRGVNPRIADYREWSKNWREKGDIERAESIEKDASDIESGAKLASAEDDFDRDYDAPTVLEGWAYKGRNYDLFAILADVRNGHGFAGSYTGEGFRPMSEAKGLPEDISPDIKQAAERWDGDGHSHSWFTVKELTDYDWEQETNTLKPGLYDMRTPLEELRGNTEAALYKDCAGSFFTKTIPNLKEHAEDDLGSVRVVFWFDN